MVVVVLVLALGVEGKVVFSGWRGALTSLAVAFGASTAGNAAGSLGREVVEGRDCWAGGAMSSLEARRG